MSPSRRVESWMRETTGGRGEWQRVFVDEGDDGREGRVATCVADVYDWLKLSTN